MRSHFHRRDLGFRFLDVRTIGDGVTNESFSDRPFTLAVGKGGLASAEGLNSVLKGDR